MSSYSSPQQAATPSPAVSSATFGPGTSGKNIGSKPCAPASRPNNATQDFNHYSVTAAPAHSAASNGSTIDAPYVIEGPSGRILCVADVRGNIKTLNALAAEHHASAILHTGDFGFYDTDSLDRISDKTLRHLVQYSTLIPQHTRTKLLGADPVRGAQGLGAAGAASSGTSGIRSQIASSPTPLLSEFPLLLGGALKLDVPVFTVWGACEDVAILERFRLGEYQVHNLQILDEATTRAVEVGGVRLRLYGLGGAVVYHKLFDNGEGAATIAGGQGTMWTTILQIGELIDTAQKHFDPSETRILITHASPGREGLLTQVALAVKADLTISAGLHFRYGLSYNEFSVQHDTENFRNKLVHAKAAFGEVWDTVKTQVEDVIDPYQRVLLNHALTATNRVPPLATATGAASEEPAWKNTWNWNLPDAAYGSLVLNIRDGRIGSEMRSQGFNFAYRKNILVSGTSANAPSPIAHNGAAAAHPGNAGSPVAKQATSGTPASGSPDTASVGHKSPVAGPAAGFHKNPPSGPKGAGGAQQPHKNHGPFATSRGQYQRAGTGGSGPMSSSESEQTKSKHQQYQHHQHQHQHQHHQHPSKLSKGALSRAAAEGAARDVSRDAQGNGQQGKDVVKESAAAKDDTASGIELAATKTKKPRGAKHKGLGGSKSGAEGGETSGAEGLTNANEGVALKKDFSKPKKRDESNGNNSGNKQNQAKSGFKDENASWDKAVGPAEGGGAGKEGGYGSRGSRGGSRGGRGGSGRGSGRGGRGGKSFGAGASTDGPSSMGDSAAADAINGGS